MSTTEPPSRPALLAPPSGLPQLVALVIALAASACADSAPSVEPPVYKPARTFSVEVSRPASPPRVVTDRVDALGRPVTIGCATCHSLGLGNPERKSGEAPTEFHTNLVVQHGDLLCRACHEAPTYASLHLADGRSLPYVEVQTLCRQCHGPQARDFDRGSHGGMTGHWDLSRGPRQRHHCTVCHDPHAPAYVGMMPARGPVDPRFGTPANEEH